MWSIGTEFGVVLVFSSKKDLETVISHLSSEVEWIDENGVEPPYLYSIHDTRIPADEVKDELDNIKKAMK